MKLSELRQAVAAGPPYDPALLAALEADPRAGAQTLYRQCAMRLRRQQTETQRLTERMQLEYAAQAQGYALVAGIDEAGRGPLAGPIVAAAVILTGPVPGLNDSKQMSAVQRERLFLELHRGGHAIGVGTVDVETIDAGGIQAANYRAMMQAVMRLDPMPDFLLVDGFSIPGCRIPQQRVIKGDQKSLSIAAASIVAKVVRDRIMSEYDRRYPCYGFGRHKGYGTADHIEALRQYGPCSEHRTSFAPVAQYAVPQGIIESQGGRAACE